MNNLSEVCSLSSKRKSAFESLIFVASAILLFSPDRAFAEECPIQSAALVTTAGEESSLGSLSQAFVVPPAYETIAGRIRFLSNEWPEYFGTEFNDTYLVRFTSEGASSVIASGNVNSSTWSTGIQGFNGKTPEENYSLDMSGKAGKTVTLIYEVRDVGDTVVDSAIAVDAVNVVRTQQYVPAGGGVLTGNGSISGQFGQAVKLTFTNNNVLGATITVSDSGPFGQSFGLILLPLQSRTFTFSKFGGEPISWNFNVSTVSDAFVVSYAIESTWVTGMPVNPCF